MTSWSKRRQSLYGASLILVFVLILGGLGFLLFYEAPTCSDGRQNGDEAGVDCGGSCQNICVFDARKPATLWSRSFAVAPGVYNAAAYIENANTEAVSNTVGYVFRLYDERNVLVAERRGSTHITKVGIVPIFEGGIETGNRTVARTLFEFTDEFSWSELDQPLPTLSVTRRTLSNAAATPRIDATIQNTSLKDAFDVSAVAVVFNQEGNAIAASRTTIPLLEGGSSRDIVFTWPSPFPESAGQVDIITRVPSAR